MWFIIAVSSLFLAIIGFIYAFGLITNAEREPSTFLKWYVEAIFYIVFLLFGFSIFSLGKFVFDIVKCL